MKRKLLIVSILVICVATLAAGTLAYFTAEGTAHNVITTGGVEIEIKEWADSEKKMPFENLNGVMPNTSVTKIAEVTNTGESDAWVRVRVEKKIQLTGEDTANESLLGLDLNTEYWKAKEQDDGYLYYTEPVKPGETTQPIFTTVTFDKTMGNEYQGATVTVDIYAQAVQTANNGETVFAATGWPE